MFRRSGPRQNPEMSGLPLVARGVGRAAGDAARCARALVPVTRAAVTQSPNRLARPIGRTPVMPSPCGEFYDGASWRITAIIRSLRWELVVGSWEFVAQEDSSGTTHEARICQSINSLRCGT